MAEGFPKDPELRGKVVREFPLLFLEMLPSQERFIRVRNLAGRTPRRRLYESGNKSGKCITGDTKVSTPRGDIPVEVLYREGQPFDIHAWDRGKIVVAKASAPFKKSGTHPCYRVSFSDGTSLGVADYHRVLTDRGWLFVQHLYESSFYHLESNRVACLSVLPSGVVHLSERQLGYLSNYLGDSRLCDGPLHLEEGNGKGDSPLSDDVQGHSPSVLKTGDRAYKYTNIPYGNYDHLSSLYDRIRFVGRFFESLIQDVYKRFQSFLCEPLSPWRLSIVGHSPSRSCGVFFADLRLSDNVVSSYNPPDVGNSIVSLTPIPCQAVYDFEVEKYHNYLACGLIHHNTEVGVAEDLAHSFGFRPWLPFGDRDRGVSVKVPNVGLVCGETVMHSIAEKLEPTFRRLVPKTCSPVWKPGPTGVLMKLTLPFDCYGEKCGSVIYFRSYDQRPDTFEGIDFDWIHWDEPPPEECLKAAERGKVVSNAPSWFTMTPLKEPYIFDQFSSKAAIVI